MVQLISGTWDFKWPQGKSIKVAFQELPAADAKKMPKLEEIIERYTAIAKRWLVRGPNIGFDFLPEYLPAPTKIDRALNLRSPRTGEDPVDYDVLVSFAVLPGTVFGDTSPDNTAVTGQVSVLGSYAQRINYGTPTTIVGPNREHAPPKAKSFHAYFDGDIFDEVVLHEVGHVLGIAHQQQNPLYQQRPQVRADAPIRRALKRIRTKYWTEFAPQIDEEIRRSWPALPLKGRKVPYSDWQPTGNLGTRRLENLTVMAHPIWSDLVEGDYEALDEPHKKPTPWDHRQILSMYPSQES